MACRCPAQSTSWPAAACSCTSIATATPDPSGSRGQPAHPAPATGPDRPPSRACDPAPSFRTRPLTHVSTLLQLAHPTTHRVTRHPRRRSHRAPARPQRSRPAASRQTSLTLIQHRCHIPATLAHRSHRADHTPAFAARATIPAQSLNLFRSRALSSFIPGISGSEYSVRVSPSQTWTTSSPDDQSAVGVERHSADAAALGHECLDFP